MEGEGGDMGTLIHEWESGSPHRSDTSVGE
jgi:hypothetical protein